MVDGFYFKDKLPHSVISCFSKDSPSPNASCICPGSDLFSCRHKKTSPFGL